MIRSRAVVAAVTLLVVGVAVPGSAHAQNYNFSFNNGLGVFGNLMLTYGTTADSKYANGYEITGVSGTFSDLNTTVPINNATIGSLVPINPTPPADPNNAPAPHDFSTFAVAGFQPSGVLTFDNLFWPAGAPVTCVDFLGAGGFLDTYGLMFNIGNGQVVDMWSNGIGQNGVADYGLAVATANSSEDYLQGGITTTTTPEPGTLWLVGTGLVGLITQRRRTRGAKRDA